MTKFITVILSLILLSACGKGMPDSLYNKEKTTGESYSYFIDEPVSFTEKTFASSLGSSLSAAVFKYNVPQPDPVSEHSSLIANYDPAEIIAKQVTKEMEQQFGLVAKKSANPKYSVRFQTNQWGIKNHPIAVTNYSVNYGLTATYQNLQTNEKKRARCYEKTDSIYGFDELYEKKSIVLKKVIKTLSEQCVTEVMNDFFGTSNNSK